MIGLFRFLFIDKVYSIDQIIPNCFTCRKLILNQHLNYGFTCDGPRGIVIVAALSLSRTRFKTAQIIELIAVYAIVLNGTSLPPISLRENFIADDHNSTVTAWTAADLDDLIFSR